jgi:hypothetical protein
MKLEDEMIVLNDDLESRGELSRLAYPGDNVVVYGPTWIVRGKVIRVGPLAFELADAGIVYKAGAHEERQRGQDTWKGLQWERWPHSLIRVPALGVFVVVLDAGEE